jgi:hypothetical protein
MRRVWPLCAALMLAVPASAFALPKHSSGSHHASKRPTELKLHSPAPSDAAPATTSAAPATHGPTRIDFDDRLIQGQSNKSGAVYLYERKELKTNSMVKKRDSFRDEIIRSVFDS